MGFFKECFNGFVNVRGTTFDALRGQYFVNNKLGASVEIMEIVERNFVEVLIWSLKWF